jgi:uncharacterized protein YcfL
MNRNLPFGAHLASLTLLLTVTVVTGCSDPMKAPPAGQRDLLPADQYPHIVAIEGLAKELRFGQPIVDQPTEQRPLRVIVHTRSTTARQGLNIQYRFEWVDEAGRPVEPDSGWQFVHLEPRVLTPLPGAALDTSAVDWRLVVRSAR